MKFFGDRAFYRTVLGFFVPIMIQNVITNFVNMLDNLMVGSIGTVEMSGVAVANQLIFVFQLCLFGLVSGAGIFGAQFAGTEDTEGLRNTFRFKVLFALLITVLMSTVFTVAQDRLIGSFLQGEGTPEAAAATMSFAKLYLMLMLPGLFPFAITNCYASTLRETGQTVVPMAASIVGVMTNLCFNYILIFGKLGLPALGVAGAASATIIARTVECTILIVWTRRNRENGMIAFIDHAYSNFRIPADLCKKIIIKGTPLLLNETMWAAGLAKLNQCYSLRSLDVVPAQNISSTFYNLFAVVFLSMGTTAGIIIGQRLGAGKTERIHETVLQLTTFSCLLASATAACYIVLAGYIPLLYNTEPEIQRMATNFMRISALAMPGNAIVDGVYFAIRSGGKTVVTFLLDSGFVWAVFIPVAVILVHFTSLPVLQIFFIIQMLMYLKAIISVLIARSGFWVNNIVEK